MLQRQYWRFYWPLALTGMILLIARQCQNGVLARYDQAEHELATLAFAMSVFMPFGAMLVFVPQMVNVLARSREARGVCLRFTLAVSVALSVPVVLLGFLPAGRRIVAWTFGLDAPTLDAVVIYLRLLWPVILIRGLQGYFTGLLIQGRYTRTVTALNVVYLAAVIGMLALGWRLGWPPFLTLAGARLVSATLHLALACLLYAIRYQPPEKPEHADLNYADMLRFFWPVATTSLMFALSRPVIYAFLNRTGGAVITIAALRVAFDLGMIFHAPANQFRHLFVTFGSDDPAGTRRFMMRVVIALSVAMAVVAFTPLSGLILGELLHIRGRTLLLARQTVMVLCATPLIITIRNYFHGRLMTNRRTRGMAAGGILRVAVIYVASWSLFELGWLNHVGATVVMQLGFTAEAVVSAVFVWWSRRESALATEGAGR